MARVKGAQIRKVRKKKLFRRAKGFFLGRQNLRQAKAWTMRADYQAYVGRKQRKRHFRRLWTQRINAASRQHGLPYSRLMHGLKLAGVDLNRKMLSELAIHDADTFKAIADASKAARA